MGACPPEKFWISDLMWSFLVYSWGEIANPRLLQNLVVFEACKTKGVTPLRAAEAAKQLFIHVRCGKISGLILPSLPRASGSIYVNVGHVRSNSWCRSWCMCVIATVQAEVCSSSVSIVHVVGLCIVFRRQPFEARHGTHWTPSGFATAE